LYKPLRRDVRGFWQRGKFVVGREENENTEGEHGRIMVIGCAYIPSPSYAMLNAMILCIVRTEKYVQETHFLAYISPSKYATLS
jgi:hypothetical protein